MLILNQEHLARVFEVFVPCTRSTSGRALILPQQPAETVAADRQSLSENRFLLKPLLLQPAMNSLSSHGCFDLALDDASRLCSLASGPAGRDPRPPAPTPCARTIACASAAADARRPAALGLVVTRLGPVADSARTRQTRNRHRVASARFRLFWSWKSP
jgi:hypothetical protein